VAQGVDHEDQRVEAQEGQLQHRVEEVLAEQRPDLPLLPHVEDSLALRLTGVSVQNPVDLAAVERQEGGVDGGPLLHIPKPNRGQRGEASEGGLLRVLLLVRVVGSLVIRRHSNNQVGTRIHGG